MRKILGNFILWALTDAETEHRVQDMNGWHNMSYSEWYDHNNNITREKWAEFSERLKKLEEPSQNPHIHFPTPPAITAAPLKAKRKQKPKRGGKRVKP